MVKKYILLILTALFIGFIFIAFLLGGAYVTWTEQKKEVVKSIQDYKNQINQFRDGIRPDPIEILDKNGITIGEFYLNPFEPVRTDNLHNYQMFIWAVLSMEDKEFYEHSGINWIAVVRAVFVNITRFSISQGGSTISQQLAKLTMKLGDRSIFNKATEIYATYFIESELSKDEILAIYLNKIFLGQGNNGIESAARYYFNKPGEELTPAEAAMIVGSIPAPSIYNPVNNLRISLARQRLVLMAMARNENIHHRPSQYNNLKYFEKTIDKQLSVFRTTYRIQEIEDEGKQTKYHSIIADRGYDRNFKLNLAPDFNSLIREYIDNNYHRTDLENRRIIIHTTLDYNKQVLADISLKQGIEDVRNSIEESAKQGQKRKKKVIDSKVIDEISKGMRASFVGLEPSTGNVEVFINSLRISSSYRPNRIETTYRQPGSTIKALIYAMAFERRRYNQSSIVRDEHIEINGYSPKNWYAGYKGDVTVRRSIAQSINTIPVMLLNEIGVDRFIAKLTEILDIHPEDIEKRFPRNLTLALGSAELTPMELGIIYATIQNGGKKIIPRKIIKISDSNSLEEFSFPYPETYQVLDPVACAMALDVLQAVLTEEGTMPIKSNAGEKLPIAGKTGTVQSPKESRVRWGNLSGVRDAWFAGMFPGLTSVVWIGNEWGAPFPGSGSGTTGRVWWRFTKALTEISPTQENRLISGSISGNYLQMDICTDDGTQLEEDWDKITMEIAKPIAEKLDAVPEGINPNSKPINETLTIPNPRYCKLPAYSQFYYAGEGPPKRNIPPIITIDMITNNKFKPADSSSSMGESEINRMDTTETSRINPGLTEDDSSIPVREGAVELEIPYYYEPQGSVVP